MFHLGHEEMIQKSLELCEQTIIFIGSAQESSTQKNPFSYNLRKEVIENVFWPSVIDGKIKIYPLEDIGVGNNANWGEYVLTSAKQLGYIPDLFISGKETRRTCWLDNEVNIAELYVPKSIDVSASLMREKMIKNDFVFWKKHTNIKLWSQYEILRKIVLNAQNNTETKSI